MVSNPLLTPSISEDTAAVFPGTRYMPIMSSPLSSTMFVHRSTSNGTNSENDDCKTIHIILKYNSGMYWNLWEAISKPMF
jgi:hypothetical protein